MPYILIERKRRGHNPVSEIEIVTTPDMYSRIVYEVGFLLEIKNYISRTAQVRQRLGMDNKEVRKERPEVFYDSVEECNKSFYSLVMHREYVEQSNCN